MGREAASPATSYHSLPDSPEPRARVVAVAGALLPPSQPGCRSSLDCAHPGSHDPWKLEPRGRNRVPFNVPWKLQSCGTSPLGRGADLLGGSISLRHIRRAFPVASCTEPLRVPSVLVEPCLGQLQEASRDSGGWVIGPGCFALTLFRVGLVCSVVQRRRTRNPAKWEYFGGFQWFS